MRDERTQLLKRIWAAEDEAYDLMCEYHSLPHHYGENILYQAEGQIIDLIAEHPDITITDLAGILHKTPNACSQIVRKLRDKDWVVQERNSENNRQFKLRLTEGGEVVYQDHTNFNRHCQTLTFEKLHGYTEEELALFLRIQGDINSAFADDVRRSREHFV